MNENVQTICEFHYHKIRFIIVLFGAFQVSSRNFLILVESSLIINTTAVNESEKRPWNHYNDFLCCFPIFL